MATAIMLFVSNAQLEINRQFHVDSALSGIEFCQHVYEALELKGHVSAIGGRMRLQFTYQLLKNDILLDELETPLATLGIADGSQIALKVSVVQIAHNRVSAPVGYRAEGSLDDIIPLPILKRLLAEAFGHLKAIEQIDER